MNGYQVFNTTTAATTLLTVAAGRTWSGTIGANCSIANAAAATAAGRALAVFATAGTGVTPAPGTIFAVEAKAGANATGGTVGSQASIADSMPVIIVAPRANAVTVTVATTHAGTNTAIHAWASGRYVS